MRLLGRADELVIPIGRVIDNFDVAAADDRALTERATIRIYDRRATSAGIERACGVVGIGSLDPKGEPLDVCGDRRGECCNKAVHTPRIDADIVGAGLCLRDLRERRHGPGGRHHLKQIACKPTLGRGPFLGALDRERID